MVTDGMDMISSYTALRFPAVCFLTTRPSCEVDQKVYAKIKNVNLNELFKEWASAERKIVTAHLLSSEITALTVSVAVDMLVNAHNVY